ncbi:MAG: 4Fe-4S binding protein [Candidatus Nanoarchaeia archaeon]|nr:4Fe-4S binding protein [Candidatus Nanoarchaeia archaeon]
MGHLTSKSYFSLQKRLNDAVQGGPNTEIFHKILDLLFSEEEAKVVTILPLNMFKIEDVQKKIGKTKTECKKILNGLADKGILFDFKFEDTQAYFLAPTMAGFFEFTLMRTDNNRDHKIFSELLSNYLHKDKKYLKEVFISNPGIARVYPNEEVFLNNKSVVLDYERAEKIIKSASVITLGRCFCRHKMQHQGKLCKYPQETCMTLNQAAESAIRHNLAKKITKEKALEILKRCRDIGLVQIGDNVEEEVNWLCNCCSCCCEALNAYKKLGNKSHLSSNFVALNNRNVCLGCKICLEKCPVGAIKMRKISGKDCAFVNKNKCIGCGVCVHFCPSKSLSLERIKDIQIVPKDTFERIILTALNKGKLQNYLFENDEVITHRVLNRFLGFILSLEPSKRLIAQRQLRSRFLNMIAKTHLYSNYDKVLHKKGEKIDYNHSEIDLMKKK